MVLNSCKMFQHCKTRCKAQALLILILVYGKYMHIYKLIHKYIYTCTHAYTYFQKHTRRMHMHICVLKYDSQSYNTVI